MIACRQMWELNKMRQSELSGEIPFNAQSELAIVARIQKSDVNKSHTEFRIAGRISR